jgi:hypothetical protein
VSSAQVKDFSPKNTDCLIFLRLVVKFLDNYPLFKALPSNRDFAALGALHGKKALSLHE